MQADTASRKAAAGNPVSLSFECVLGIVRRVVATPETTRPAGREPLVLLAVGVVLLALSGFRPADRFTWWLEVFPIFLILPIVIATHRRFPLTSLLYRLILVHAAILMLGAHYTYAEVPIGFWIRDAFGFARNHYDRLGHLAQGFIPAIAAREILLRTTPLRPGRMLFALVVCVCLALSAAYELSEWWVAVLTGTAADAFLGTQGDPWDTQWDMLMAAIGAIVAQLTLAGVHDRALARLPDGAPEVSGRVRLGSSPRYRGE